MVCTDAARATWSGLSRPGVGSPVSRLYAQISSLPSKGRSKSALEVSTYRVRPATASPPGCRWVVVVAQPEVVFADAAPAVTRAALAAGAVLFARERVRGGKPRARAGADCSWPGARRRSLTSAASSEPTRPAIAAPDHLTPELRLTGMS